MSTPISVPYIVRLLYTAGSITHKMELYCPNLSGISSDSFDTITIGSGASSGATLTAAVNAVISAAAPLVYSDVTFTVAELYSYSATAPHLIPLASKSFNVPGSSPSGTVYGSQVVFVMRKGRAYGRFQLLDQTQHVPQRGNPPKFGGSGAYDPAFAIFNAQQYFSLRNGTYPDTAFGVSVQYNARELRARGLRP